MIEPLRLVQTAHQHVAYIPFRISPVEMRKVMGPGLAELRAVIAAQNIAVTGPWFTHHVRDPGAVFDFEICLPVATPVAAENRVLPGEWPAMSVARTVYHGGYEGLGAGWSEFLAAIAVAGRAPVEGLWERYLVGPDANPDPAAWRTELSKRLT